MSNIGWRIGKGSYRLGALGRLLLVSVVLFVISESTLSGQSLVGVGARKEKKGGFEKIRKSLGLSPEQDVAARGEPWIGDQLRGEPWIGDQLREGLDSYDPVTDSLILAIRRPIKKLDISQLQEDGQQALKHVRRTAEGRVRSVVLEVSGGQISAELGRQKLRAIFSDFVSGLEAVFDT
jgi:hypothetical protein